MALYLKKKLENEATIGVWQITESEAELIELSSTPSDEMEEISFIQSESQRKQRLAVRALLNAGIIAVIKFQRKNITAGSQSTLPIISTI